MASQNPGKQITSGCQNLNIDFALTGVDDVVKRMRDIPVKLQKKGLRSATRKAMKIVRDDARKAAEKFDDPFTPQKIDKLIVIQESARRSKREGGVVMRVGIRGGAVSSDERVPPWYWRLKEFGTSRQQAEPFMRPALANNIDAVTNTFSNEVNAELDKLGV